MTWYVIHRSDTGEAVSITSTQPDAAEMTAKGLSVFSTEDDAPSLPWDPIARTLGAAPPVPLRVATDRFIAAFPDAKWLALKNAAATNGTLMKFYDRIMSRDTINVRDPDVVQGFALLEAGGLLTPAEANAIKTTLGVS